ncbi:MAG: hypothetical protein QXS91_02975 [Candidatus Anstonellales archaeon]
MESKFSEIFKKRKKEERSKQHSKELDSKESYKNVIIDSFFATLLLLSVLSIRYAMIKAATDKREQAAIQRICENDAAELKNILDKLVTEKGETIQVYGNNSSNPVVVQSTKKLIEAIAKCYEVKQRGNALFDEETGH